jgi:G:T-mismatch repair DNA endonuclease (very short patch repair protein)
VQNRKFWASKLAANRNRDRLVRRTLESRGWRVLRIWEHELSRRNQGRLLARVKRSIDKGIGKIMLGRGRIHHQMKGAER